MFLTNSKCNQPQSRKEHSYDPACQNYCHDSLDVGNVARCPRHHDSGNGAAHYRGQVGGYFALFVGIFCLSAYLYHYSANLWQTRRTLWAQTDVSLWLGSVFAWFNTMWNRAKYGATDYLPSYPGSGCRCSVANCPDDYWRHLRIERAGQSTGPIQWRLGYRQRCWSGAGRRDC